MHIQTVKVVQKVLHLSLALALIMALAAPLVLSPAPAAAAPCKVGQVPDIDKCEVVAPCDASGKDKNNACSSDPARKCSGGRDCGLVAKYINPLINFLEIIVGLVVTIAMVAGGIQYTTAADDPGKVAAAKSRITNALLGLLAFLFLYAFLQWIVPGGFLNG